MLPPKGHPKIEAPRSRRKGWPPNGKRPGGGPSKTFPTDSEETGGKPSGAALRGDSSGKELPWRDLVEGSIDGSSEEKLSRTLRRETPVADPPRRERSGRHPRAPPVTGAPRSPGRGDAPVRWCPAMP